MVRLGLLLSFSVKSHEMIPEFFADLIWVRVRTLDILALLYCILAHADSYPVRRNAKYLWCNDMRAVSLQTPVSRMFAACFMRTSSLLLCVLCTRRIMGGQFRMFHPRNNITNSD